MKVVPYRPEFEAQVVALILEIQREEFGIEITAEAQPDLRQIPGFYQLGRGNFWVALTSGGESSSKEEVIGTIGLLDVGSAQAALRKMFVHRNHRGAEVGTASRLLDTLLDWSIVHGVAEIFLGTTSKFHAAHRFYEKNGFEDIEKSSLPASFPVMDVDTKFYRRGLSGAAG